jgi:pyridoxine 5-phosphate synthase
MTLSTHLSVNVNKVAWVRNTRHLGIPSVTRAATLCLQAGAQGITVHPRPDERHIRAHDVHDLAQLMRAWPDREFNIEGNPLHNLMDFVREVRPHQATFVPDTVGQFTSDHGWSFPADAQRLRPIIDECKALGVRVSLFMDPVAGQTGWSSIPSPMLLPGGSLIKNINCIATHRRRRPHVMWGWA